MKQYNDIKQLSQFDKSMAILVGLSPHTFCHEDWLKTKELVWKIIYPLFGTYFLIKKNTKGYFLDTILDELGNESTISDSQILRIVNGENMGIVFEPDNHNFNNLQKKHNVALGIGIIKSKVFKKDYTPDTNNLFNNYENFSTHVLDYNTELSIGSFKYLLKMHYALPQEDKNILIEINKKLILNIKPGLLPINLIDFENYEMRPFISNILRSKDPQKQFTLYNQESTKHISYFREKFLVPGLMKMLDEIK